MTDVVGVDAIDVFFFQAEDGIRDLYVTGVQTCALPICLRGWSRDACAAGAGAANSGHRSTAYANGSLFQRPNRSKQAISKLGITEQKGELIMRYTRFIQVSWTLLLAILLVGLVVTPVSAATTAPRLPAHGQDTASLGATIYLSTATLRSLFQSKLNQEAPSAVDSAISGMVSKLPPQDQGWAYQMATTLIQPSAALLSLAPQHAGLATTIRLSLYPGDPHPITSSMLIGFSVANASTVQVSAHSLNGSPALVNGPLTTFQIPVGQLNGINTTPFCGDSSLAVKVHFPVTIGPLPTPPPPQGLSTSVQSHTSRVDYSAVKRLSPNGVAAYGEIPSSPLAAMGPAIGSW